MDLLPWRKSASIPVRRHIRPYQLNSLQDEINSVFDGFMNMDFPSFSGKSDMSSYAPTTDIMDEGDHYTVVAELPGINIEDINVSVESGCLTVKAERKEESEEEKKDYLLRESWAGSFYRSIALPDNVDNEKNFSADFKNGILNVTLPKLKESEHKAKKIKVNDK